MRFLWAGGYFCADGQPFFGGRRVSRIVAWITRKAAGWLAYRLKNPRFLLQLRALQARFHCSFRRLKSSADCWENSSISAEL